MTAITTTAAATQAGVTVATVRTWCRIGAVAAAKKAGRWVVDAASLAHRLAIGAMKARKAPKPVVYSVETITAIGGNLWERHGKRRVYLNDWPTLAGIDWDTYKTGNISSATYQGEPISNRQAGLLLGSIDKIWFDDADGKLHCRFGYTESREATREELWQAVIAGVRDAIAAL